MSKKSKIQQARDVLAIQGYDGNWNYDPYMQGMYNGMELIVAIIEGRKPQYRESPEKWLSDFPGTHNPEPSPVEMRKL